MGLRVLESRLVAFRILRDTSWTGTSTFAGTHDASKARIFLIAPDDGRQRR